MKEEMGTASQGSAGAARLGPLIPPFRTFKHSDSRGWCVKDKMGVHSIYAVGLQLDEEAASEQIAQALNAVPGVPEAGTAEGSQWAIEHNKTMLPRLFDTKDQAYAWLEENKKGAGSYWVREVRSW